MKKFFKSFLIFCFICFLLAFLSCKKEGLVGTTWENSHSTVLESGYKNSTVTTFEFCKKNVLFLTTSLAYEDPETEYLNTEETQEAFWKLKDGILSIVLGNGNKLVYKAVISGDVLVLSDPNDDSSALEMIRVK